MHTNGPECREENQTLLEKFRVTAPCAGSIREEGTGSLWKAVFIGVHPWLNCIVPAQGPASGRRALAGPYIVGKLNEIL
jgi:hypothetical protein